MQLSESHPLELDSYPPQKLGRRGTVLMTVFQSYGPKLLRRTFLSLLSLKTVKRHIWLFKMMLEGWV